MLIYLPIRDQALIRQAEGAVIYRNGSDGVPPLVHNGRIDVLSGVGRNDTLYVLAHGRESTSSQIGGIVGQSVGMFGKTKAVCEYLTAYQLAERMLQDGLTQEHGDVRLLACWGGLGRKKFGHKKETPFAAQLCSALKQLGYERMIVTGFTGATLDISVTRAIVINKGINRKKYLHGSSSLVESGYSVKGLANTEDSGTQSLLELLNNNQLNQSETKTVWY